MYCTIPSVKQSFSASIPLFSFSINILSFFLFLHTSDTWRQIRCRILFEASEKNFANRSGVKSFTAMIQIDMNLDFESYFSRGLFFPGFFPPLLPLNLIEEAQSSLISYLAKLAHRSNQQWNRNSKREALTVSASATLIKPLRLTRLPSFIFCQNHEYFIASYFWWGHLLPFCDSIGGKNRELLVELLQYTLEYLINVHNGNSFYYDLQRRRIWCCWPNGE